jgi:desulfoferrodoxin-like iron-binding protein
LLVNAGASDKKSPVYSSGGPVPGNFQYGRDKNMVNVSKEGQVFKCEICGNVVVVKEAGGGELICCGEPMVLEE